ncbi:hypothetical protein LOCC1_G003885 [Lachnellula occidentalis]|uniref:Uncharacterized protein n=1 Tax=Lachnellula occidentalis TaxID=215460 RepID=A0A8H8S7G9_9HELO|nr:hypothetical protein LOCC1_G003885 [Lachnellula occidentalis]
MAPLPLSNLEAASSAISNIAKRLPTELINSVLGRDPIPQPQPTSTTTTSTANSLLSRILSSKRSTSSIIPTGYGSIDSGPAPGTIVGIVIGSVAGFLLILWLLYTCLNFNGGGGNGFGGGESAYTESVPRERRKSHHSGSRRSRRDNETIEIRSQSQVRAPSPIRIVREPSPPRMERVIVEERREERRGGGSDEVVVIEEHSPPRRKKKNRDRDREREISRERDVDSGFRTVDPLAFGGVVGGNPRRGSRRVRD